MVGGGHAWQGGLCVAGGMPDGGVCVVGGNAWQGACVVGACVAGGGVHGWGVCMPCTTPPPPSRYYGFGIWSISRWYASYWNAFLFINVWVFLTENLIHLANNTVYLNIT